MIFYFKFNRIGTLKNDENLKCFVFKQFEFTHTFIEAIRLESQ